MYTLAQLTDDVNFLNSHVAKSTNNTDLMRSLEAAYDRFTGDIKNESQPRMRQDAVILVSNIIELVNRG